MRRLALLLGAWAAGCAPAVDLTRPPDVRAGVDACDHCKMIINELRFAAAYYDDEGTPRRFDDIRCLLTDLAGSRLPDHPVWVHDYLNEQWLPAREALFVRDAGIHTAMGSGLVAVSSAEAAAGLIGDGPGSIAAFDQLAAE